MLEDNYLSFYLLKKKSPLQVSGNTKIMYNTVNEMNWKPQKNKKGEGVKAFF